MIYYPGQLDSIEANDGGDALGNAKRVITIRKRENRFPTAEFHSDRVSRIREQPEVGATEGKIFDQLDTEMEIFPLDNWFEIPTAQRRDRRQKNSDWENDTEESSR